MTTTNTARDKAKELMSHYLTHAGAYGYLKEAEDVVDLIIEAAVEAMKAELAKSNGKD